MKKKKFILIINYGDSDQAIDLENLEIDEEIVEHGNLTKEMLICEYLRLELFKGGLDFKILSEDRIELDNEELKEIGLLDNDGEWCRKPNLKGHLLDNVFELFNNSRGIGIFGDHFTIRKFIRNLLVNSPRKIVLYENMRGMFLSARSYNPDLVNNIIFKDYYDKYEFDKFEETLKDLDEPKDNYILIISRVDFIKYETDLIDKLNASGFKFIVTDGRHQENKESMRRIQQHLDNVIEISEISEKTNFAEISVSINEDEYIYKIDSNTKLFVDCEIQEKKDPAKAFDKVAGFEELKEELKLISSWWVNRDEIRKEGIDIPHGVLFHGVPGTGKSLIARAFVDSLDDCEVISIDGNKDSMGRNEVVEKFNKAKSLDKLAVVFIDEIDLLSRFNERELLNQLDSLNSKSNVFIVATCNNFDSIDGPLTRKDRLDFIFEIGLPNEIERINILRYYFEKCNVETNIQYDYLGFITEGLNAADLKGVANETRLRFGAHPTMNNIEYIVDKISKREQLYYGNNDTHVDYMVAVHEIAHAVVASYNKEYFTFYKASLESNSRAAGLCKIFPTKVNSGDYNRYLADIEISLAGNMACKELFNYLDSGSMSDLERARHLSAFLVNSLAYSGFSGLLNHDRFRFDPSEKKMKRNEYHSGKILSQCEKRVRKIIRKNKKEIKELANLLMEKKYITQEDLDRYIA